MITIGSDFSGVGAFDQALIRLGISYKTVFACDVDKFARQTYIHNYGEPGYFPENVYDREIPKEPLDIYVTTPPCQSFSLAGKRLGEDDKRGVLFYNSHEFIQKNRPRYFIFENVKGLLSDDSGKTFQRWLDMLGGKSVNGNPVIFPHEESVPYHVYWKVLNAKYYNVPQNRERVFIVGIREDLDNDFRWPKPEPLTKRLKDILEDNVDEKYFLSDNALAYMSKPATGGYSDRLSFMNDSKNDTAGCITANHSKGVPYNCMKIQSNTKKGFDIAYPGDSINFSVPNSKTRRGRVGKEVAQTLDTACNQGVFIGSIRGRNPDNPKSRVSGLPTEQMMETEFNEFSNTLTTVQKDNVVVQIGINDRIHGWHENENVIAGHRNDLKRSTVSEHVYHKKDGICTTIQTAHVPKLADFRIRKLTPMECFRLMDFPDSFTWPVSDSQAYKQAGNSVVVKMFELIIKNLIKQ